MQIEHEPWLPKNDDRVEGQKIAIVGYSHYVDGSDRSSLTNEVVQCVVDREYNFRFYKAIQGYFGFADPADFWNRVIFFNFLPDAVGPRSEKYAAGKTEQLERGRERFLRIINSEKPEKVFVFTSKGWRAFPETTVEEISGGVCTPLLEDEKEPNWGTYMAGDQRVLVCGFRHPQFSKGEDMRTQVQAFLKLRP
jgi:hypothetical protein